ncbi:MAG TPA: TonB C-terminal domain-containing protein, partial [Bdellovibrionales bacterium]|nr:TonB C-terminal domain-containing protein [Bdellovibrionales bacterium]
TVVRETEKRDVMETEAERRARFLSERTKRYKEEMRARDSGMSQNAGGGTPESGETARRGPGPGRIAKQFAPQSNPLLPPGPGLGARSTIGEKLPQDVRFGNFNALNSDRFLYYSFYARIEERIRPRWESSVRDIIESLSPSRVRAQEFLTNVEIQLDRTGKFQQAIVHKKSGIESLDIAAIEAFKAGAPFQNPPAEMIQPDGKIRLFYSISVTMR